MRIAPIETTSSGKDVETAKNIFPTKLSWIPVISAILLFCLSVIAPKHKRRDDKNQLKRLFWVRTHPML